MIEFLVAETDEPEDEEVSLRLPDPSPIAVAQAVRSLEDVAYGTHYILRADGSRLVAISTSGPVLKAGEPGAFLLYANGRLVKERAVREEIVRAFLPLLR